MKTYLNMLVAMVFSTTSLAAFAANENYSIFVDAGSTGSRLHIFQYDVSAPMPILNEVFSENVKPGLSSLVDDPERVREEIKTLSDSAIRFLQLKHVDVNTVPFNLFGTAGMRLLPNDKQQTIYTNITTYLKANYSFATGEVKTIPGKMEGFYGWLDVNYLAGNLQNHQPTIGSIDMGGASTQIAFATQDQSKPDDEVTVNINNHQYVVFSKSFLGLGQDQARDMMIADQGSSACYPKNYEYKSNPPESGKFDFADCAPIYQNIIQNQQVEQQMLSTKGQSFVAYSGIYYTYNFLKIITTPYQADVEKRIHDVCNETWEQLKTDYPKEADKYLSAYCANTVYQDQLLYTAYHLQGNQLTITTQLNQKDIDWILGAALYSLVK
jgi:hypothetical protein